LKNLFDNKVDPKDLSIIRALGANYKSENAFMKIFSNELRKIGKPVLPGDRLQYLIIDNGEELLGKKMILLEDYTDQKIDILYYLDKLVLKPLEQLFNIGYIKDLQKVNHIFYKPIGKKREIPINKFVKLFYQLLMDHPTKSIDQIIHLFYEKLNTKKVNFVQRNLL
jgi:DNA polymerase elongation subunit (family B)